MLAGFGSSTAQALAGKASNGLAGETPLQIVAASAAALKGVKGFRMRGTMTELTTPRKRMAIDLQIYSKSKFRMSITTAQGKFQMILDRTRAYMVANRKFWLVESHDNAAATTLFANRWILLTPTMAHSFSSSLHGVTSAQAATCMLQHGSLSLSGSTTVGNQHAILVHDAGNMPGGQPETLAIATSGPPYPLRITATGTQRPGGSGPCDSSSGPSAVGSVTLSDFGRLGSLHLPAHAISLQQLEQADPSTTPAA